MKHMSTQKKVSIFTGLLLALSLLLVLAACSTNTRDDSPDIADSVQKTPDKNTSVDLPPVSAAVQENTKKDAAAEIFTQNGKYGLQKGSDVLLNAVYDDAISRENCFLFASGTGEARTWYVFDSEGAPVGTEYDGVIAWDWAECCTLWRTDGVRTGMVWEENGVRRIGEIPNDQYWILLRDGNFLNEEPFDACMDYCGEPYGEVYCIRNGYGYRYYVDAENGSFQLNEVAEPGLQDEDYFGYRLSVYRWDSRTPCYGIVAADGTEVVAPIYERVEIPFADRFLIYEGGVSQGVVLGRCRLTDETGQTLCSSFHEISYSVFDDGYLGIALCCGERATFPCFDEEGQLMPEGYWLVDRDGKICSEHFVKLSFRDGGRTYAQSESDVLCVQHEDGTEELLTLADILMTWEP